MPLDSSHLPDLQGHTYHNAGLTSLDVHSDSTAVISGSEDGVPKVGAA